MSQHIVKNVIASFDGIPFNKSVVDDLVQNLKTEVLEFCGDRGHGIVVESVTVNPDQSVEFEVLLPEPRAHINFKHSALLSELNKAEGGPDNVSAQD